jgi:hypothetical protein
MSSERTIRIVVANCGGTVEPRDVSVYDFCNDLARFAVRHRGLFPPTRPAQKENYEAKILIREFMASQFLGYDLTKIPRDAYFFPTVQIHIGDNWVALALASGQDGYLSNKWWFGRLTTSGHGVSEWAFDYEADVKGNVLVQGKYYFDAFCYGWPEALLYDNIRGHMEDKYRSFGRLNALLKPSDKNPLSGLLKSGEPARTLAKQIADALSEIQTFFPRG